RQCPAALLSPPRYCPRRTTSAPALDRASLGARQVALERERRLLIHEAVALDRHAAVRAQRAIFTEEEPAIVHVVHQVHPEPGGEREEGGALAAALTQPASMVCRQVVQEHRRLLRHRAIRIRHAGTSNRRVQLAADE